MPNLERHAQRKRNRETERERYKRETDRDRQTVIETGRKMGRQKDAPRWTMINF